MTNISKKKAKTQPFVEVKKKFSNEVQRVVFTNEMRGTINLTSDSKSYMVAGSGITIKSGSDSVSTGFGENQIIFESTAGTAASGATVSFDPISVVYAADNAGTVADYSSGAATIKVFLGGEQINVDNTSTYSPKTFRVVQGTPVNITAGAVTQNDGNSTSTVAAPSSMTQDQAEIPYQIIVTDSDSNSLTFNVTQLFAKARKGNTGDTGATGSPGSNGTDGKDGYFVMVTPQSVSLPTTAAGTVDYTPSGATIYAFRGGTQLQGITTGTPTTGQFKVTGVTGTGISPDSTASVSGTNLVFDDAASISGNSAFITYTLNLENIVTGGQLIQTLAKAKAGANGTDGTDGIGIVIVLTPLSIVLSTDSSGNVSDFSPTGASIQVLQNGVAMTVDNSNPYSNSTFRVNSATGTGITAGSIVQIDGQPGATVQDSSNMTSDTASIEHSITYKTSAGNEATVTVTQSLAKSKQGAAGSSGSLAGSTATIGGADSPAITAVYSALASSIYPWVPRNDAVHGWFEYSDSDDIMVVYTAGVFTGSQYMFGFRKAGLFKIEMSDFDIDPPAPTGAESYSFDVTWTLVRYNPSGVDFTITQITGGSVSASGGTVTKSGINPGSTQATVLLPVPDILNFYQVVINFSNQTTANMGGKGLIVPPLGSNSRYGRLVITELTF